MKKRILLGSTLLAMLALGACKKDDVAPTNAAVELYPSPVVTMGLDIHVKASSTASARVAGLSGATVTLKQNGKTYSATTDASGIASFSDLTEGSASYYVTMAGYASYNDNVYLSYNGSLNINGTSGNTTTSNSNVAVTGTYTTSDIENVTLNKLGTSVSGVLLADLDGGGAAQTTALNTGTVVLKLTNTSLEPNVYKTSVGANGLFTFTNLPENVGYTLSTEGINVKINATGSTPEYLLNTYFPNSSNDGTTSHVGQTLYLGAIELEY